MLYLKILFAPTLLALLALGLCSLTLALIPAMGAPADAPAGASAGSLKVTMLCYHKFTREDPPDQYTVTAAAFQEQLEYLQNNNYRVVSLDYALEQLAGKNLNSNRQRLVVITVDDGHRSFYEIAYPLLQRYGYTATLYIPTGRIGEEKTWMHWEELTRLQKEGYTIASHSVDHPRLFAKHQRKKNPVYQAWLDKQLGQSKETIEQRLKIKVKHFAHPYGIYTQQVLNRLKELGYESAATVNRGNNSPGQDPFRLKRTMIFSHHTLKDFIYALENKPLPLIVQSPADGATVSGKNIIISAQTGHKAFTSGKVRFFLAHEQKQGFTLKQKTLQFQPPGGLTEGPYIAEIHAEDEQGIPWVESWLFFVQEKE